MWHFILLLLCITIWMVSLFLVVEAAKSQKWAFGGLEGIPEPYSGVFLSQVISLVFLLLWLVRTVLLTGLPYEPFQLFTQILLRPAQFTPGFLMASFPPLIVGLVKLITTLAVPRDRPVQEEESHSRLWVTLVFVVFHLLTALAAIVIFTRYFL
ncbi:MAG: hypothetical protein ACE5HC_11370 [Candidatus Binatia bacterium]